MIFFMENRGRIIQKRTKISIVLGLHLLWLIRQPNLYDTWQAVRAVTITNCEILSSETEWYDLFETRGQIYVLWPIVYIFSHKIDDVRAEGIDIWDVVLRNFPADSCQITLRDCFCEKVLFSTVTINHQKPHQLIPKSQQKTGYRIPTKSLPSLSATTDRLVSLRRGDLDVDRGSIRRSRKCLSIWVLLDWRWVCVKPTDICKLQR